MKPHQAPRLDILFSAGQIRRRLTRLADEITTTCPDKELVVVAVLKGSYVFLADLARLLAIRNIHLIIDFLCLSTYGVNTISSGKVNIRQNLSIPVKGKSVLLLDDILDSGLTLQYAKTLLKKRGARTIKTCVLLDKPSRRNVPITADFVGFTIGDTFVVGYGLDYKNHYRQLPCIANISIPLPSTAKPSSINKLLSRKVQHRNLS
jgi:hypoxanthine phosphoribosyltransferase